MFMESLHGHWPHGSHSSKVLVWLCSNIRIKSLPSCRQSMTGDALWTGLKSSYPGCPEIFFVHDRAQKFKRREKWFCSSKIYLFKEVKKKLDIFWKDHLFVVGKKLFHVPKGSHLTSCTFASILLKFFKVAIALLSLQPKKNSWWRISTKKKHTQTGHHTNFAPWKINMEPTNQPFGKENDLNQTYMRICSMLIFRGVSRIKNRGSWIHNMLPKFNSSPLKSYHLPPFFRGKLAVF